MIKGFLKYFSLAATAVLLVFCLGVITFASESFPECIEGIDKSADYATRLDRVERAESLYAELSDEEKALASDLYALLLAEKSELGGIALSAERFILSVNGLRDISDLNEKASAIENIKTSNSIFTDESYPGIEAAIEEFNSFDRSVTEAVSICEAFIEAVDVLISQDEDDYVLLSSAIKDAQSYIKLVDSTYDGIPGAISNYNNIAGAIRVKEQYTDEFLLAVEDMKTKSDYKSYSDAYDYAIDYTKSESFIPDYPGVAEAMAELGAAEELMREAIKRANAFVAYVNSIGTSGDLFGELAESYGRLSGVDFTIDVAATAKALLDSMIEEYNKTSEKINSDFSYV